MTEAKQWKLLHKLSKSLAEKLEAAKDNYRASLSGHMAEILPAEKRPIAQIVHRVVTEKEVALENLRCTLGGRSDRVTPPGTYAVLHTKNAKEEEWTLMMSDTPYEMRAASGFRYSAHGKVLIAGLGLGATTIPVLLKKEVEKVTVIETNPDVVELVSPKLKALPGGEKLDIVLDDAFIWKAPKGAKFNTIWLDIWPDICTDNLPEITKLKRKYSRLLDRTDERCWMGVWEESYLRRELRRGRL